MSYICNMRWLINYIRSCFCKHLFQYKRIYYKREGDFFNKQGYKISRTCEKCGYHKSYWEV